MNVPNEDAHPSALESVNEPTYLGHKSKLWTSFFVILLLGLGAATIWRLCAADELSVVQSLDDSSQSTHHYIDEAKKNEKSEHVVDLLQENLIDKTRQRLHAFNAVAVSKLGSQGRVYALMAAVAVLIIGVIVFVTVAIVLNSGQEELLPIATPEPKPDDVVKVEDPDATPDDLTNTAPKSFFEQLDTAFHNQSILSSTTWVLGTMFAVLALLFLMIDLLFKLEPRGTASMNWTCWLFIGGTILSCACLSWASWEGGVLSSLLMASDANFVSLIWISVLVLFYVLYGIWIARSSKSNKLTDNTSSFARFTLLVMVTSLLLGCMGATGGIFGCVGAAIVACTLIAISLFGLKKSPMRLLREADQKIKGLLMLGIVIVLGSVSIVWFEPAFGFVTFVVALIGASLMAGTMVWLEYQQNRDPFGDNESSGYTTTH